MTDNITPAELTDAELNRQLAEALGRTTWTLGYATHIQAALGAFRDAETPERKSYPLGVLRCMYENECGEEGGEFSWLLLDGTARKLAEAALKALQAQKGTSREIPER